MNALAHQQVGQGDTCGQYSHPHFTILRLGALFLNLPKLIRAAGVSEEYERGSHGSLPPSPAPPACAAERRAGGRAIKPRRLQALVGRQIAYFAITRLGLSHL